MLVSKIEKRKKKKYQEARDASCLEPPVPRASCTSVACVISCWPALAIVGRLGPSLTRVGLYWPALACFGRRGSSLACVVAL
jgi:hypothetical protein